MSATSPSPSVSVYWLHVRCDCACSDDKCKVMDSKMRPLWLDFHNQDILGENILQIFKNGDGNMCI